LTEIFVDRALARAAELDGYFKRTGKVVGPLHGLPISLKDQLCIKGLETTVGKCRSPLDSTNCDLLIPGYISWIGQYAEKNAVLVDILIECGAVPFVRTNVPQTIMVSAPSR
jgi:amidase